MTLDPEQKRKYLYELEVNGFVLLRNFLPVDFLDELLEQIAPLIVGETKRIERGEVTPGRGKNRVVVDLEPYASHLKGPIEDGRFRRNPVVEEIADSVLGKWRHGAVKAECPLPGSEFMGWHPDTDDDFLRYPLRPERLTFNIPLVDINDSNGPMEIIPGSHRMKHVDGRTIYTIPRLYATKILLAKGDCMIRDGNALHRGTPNTSDHARVLLDQTYRAVRTEEEIAAASDSRWR